VLGEFIGAAGENSGGAPAGGGGAAESPTTGTPDGQWIAAFRRDLERLAGAQGLPFRDLTDALPPEDFITSNHLHDRNHKRMAELLADHIAAEMER
jgi:hypothetical protein